MTCFRPLSGSYISQCKRKTKGENHEQFPSPIGELHFSIDELIPIARDIQCFRPLSGSYISQSSTHHSAILHYRFPSPIGELHFSIVRNAYWTKKTISVSVPYRGATFLNHQWITHPRRMTQFPSPIGELHFSMMCISDVILYRICPSFRPLSGSYISQ